MSWATPQNIHQGARYLLHAYVCQQSKVTRVHDLGTRTLGQIFLDRPAGCKHAVVTDEWQGVWVFDLLDVVYAVWEEEHFHGLKPNKRTAYPDIETAITATVMTDGD